MASIYWALAAIIVIAVIAEVNPRIGWALAGLAAMGMIAAYFSTNPTKARAR